MNFLTPFYALAGLAILAPVLFHLIRRRPNKRIDFSTHLFLEQNRPQASKSPRIENWFLLFLRASAILLLATAFSRPYWGAPTIEQFAPEQVLRILLVDSSASMQREGLAEIARNKASAWIENSNNSDSIAIYACNESLVPLMPLAESPQLTPNSEQASAALKSYAPTWFGNNWHRVLNSLNEKILAAPDTTPFELILITDLQGSTNWNNLSTLRWSPNIRMYVDSVIQHDHYPNNAALRLVDSNDMESSLELNPTGLEPKRSPTKSIRVTNHSGSRTNKQPEQFEVQWQTASGDPIADAASLKATVLIDKSKHFPLNEIPANASAIKLFGDEAPFDNMFYFSQRQPQDKTLLVLGSSDQFATDAPAYFLNQIPFDTERYNLQVLSVDISQPQSQTQSSATTEPSHDIDWAKVQYVVLTTSGADLLKNQKLADQLKSYLNRGGHLLWVLDEFNDSLNQDCNAIYQHLFEQPTFGSVTEASIKDYSLLENINFNDPIFQGLSDSRFNDFTKIHIWHHRLFTPSDNSDWNVMAKFDDGGPAILRKNRSTSSIQSTTYSPGEVILFTFGWQPEQSQLALSSKFVPILSNLIDDSFGPTRPDTFRIVGESLPIPAQSSIQWHDHEKSAPLSITHATDFLLERPGILEVKTGDEPANQIAVNLPEGESWPAPIELSKLAQQGLPLNDLESREAISSEQKAALMSQELMRKRTIGAAKIEENQHFWRWILCGVIGLVFLESFCLLRRQTKLVPSPK